VCSLTSFELTEQIVLWSWVDFHSSF